MKTIGLLGGMSWESTALYYKLINEGIRKELGGLHSAQIAMYSVDFHPLEQLMAEGNWKELEKHLCQYATQIEKGGADFLLICTNTMHKLADQIQGAISIPLLHLADATAEKVKSEKKNTIGLLGTKVTMTEDFYKGRLIEQHGLNVVTPSDDDMDIVDRIIFDELCKGIVSEESRIEYQRIIGTLQEQGAKGIILGCTEICMLVGPGDVDIQLFNTTDIHAEAAVRMALKI
ncbi:aspartate/glutamate racemase family protein [Desulfopila sp. IMCC35008]|uniref:aspartate/glutamate racemase family protein n=1 Tax=Desulfopila sp. IMCC35008 TaxID=2653858 RepID=UPI0013D0B478|nr:aspartate/glutamate racemase family protein [Desulfopila sp. IMCC35008]